MPLIKNKNPRFFYGWIVVIAGLFVMIFVYGSLYTFGVFFKPLSAEFGWTRAMTSGAFSLCLLLLGFLSILAGRLNDRFGPRIVITGCGFFLGLGYLLMSQISAIWQLYLFYGVMVAVGMTAFVPLVSTVARWFVKRRGLMTGIVASGVGFGTMIMPPIGNWLISSYGWRASYIIVGIIALVLVIVAAQFLRRDPSQMGQLPYGESEVKQQSLGLEARGLSLREATQTRQFWMLCVVFSAFYFSLQSIMVHIVPHATDLEISPASAANILAIIGGLSVGGRIIMGSASDRIGSKVTVVICFILMALALFWLVAAKEIWALYLFAVIFGFAYGGLVALMSLVVADLFGLSSHGVILGGVAFISAIGEATGPVLAGHIFDISGSYNLAFLLCAALAVIAVLTACLLGSTTSKGGTNDSRRST